jgi:hypothetical protein
VEDSFLSCSSMIRFCKSASTNLFIAAFFGIPDSYFCPPRISDPGPDPNTATKERGGKKFVVLATNIAKFKIILF